MSAEELRELADWLAADDYAAQDRYRAAAYLRACADALDAGPVAWRFQPMLGSPWSLSDDGYYISCTRDRGYINEALYPLAMPALRIPEPMTPNDIHLAAGAELAGLLDHIYEYGTMSEGVMPLVVPFARAVEAETLRRVKEANK